MQINTIDQVIGFFVSNGIYKFILTFVAEYTFSKLEIPRWGTRIIFVSAICVFPVQPFITFPVPRSFCNKRTMKTFFFIHEK